MSAGPPEGAAPAPCPVGRTLVAGILNVTPDSFSDGGRFDAVKAAVARARAIADEGGHWIDLGGESTRPGHVPVPLDEELRRVLPVLEALGRPPLPLSIDTTKPDVARRALALGATIVNDQHGLQGDPAMAEVVAAAGAEVVVMAHRAEPVEGDVVADVCRFLERSLRIAEAAGIARERVIVDPGFGFGKTMPQNLALLGRLGELRALGQRILIGTSRKRMIGHVLPECAPEDRLEGTAATVAVGIMQGADIVRVHDVRAMARVARMTDAIVAAGRGRP
jgi:dihydropteroate synthase